MLFLAPFPCPRHILPRPSPSKRFSPIGFEFIRVYNFLTPFIITYNPPLSTRLLKFFPPCIQDVLRRIHLPRKTGKKAHIGNGVMTTYKLHSRVGTRVLSILSKLRVAVFTSLIIILWTTLRWIQDDSTGFPQNLSPLVDWNQRREVVRDAFVESWDAYSEHAWGKPVITESSRNLNNTRPNYETNSNTLFL